MNMKSLHMFAFTLVVIGALNWGLWALFDFNLVNALLGAWPEIEKLAYILVGLSALWVFATHRKDCKICSGK